MSACATCGRTILFGGERESGRRFCNAKCRKRGAVLKAADAVPEAAVNARVWEIVNGQCPVCSGPGPVNLHKGYRVWSGLFITSRSTRLHICCRSCATRARLKDAAYSLLLGWWGFPWGLIYTPIQIGRNLVAISRAEDGGPAPELAQFVRGQLAAQSALSAMQAPSFVPPR